MKKDKRTVNVTAKVSLETKRRLERIRDRYGFRSIYEIVQYLLSAFLRQADAEGEDLASQTDARTASLWEAARLFEGFENRRSRLVTTAPSPPPERRLREVVALFDVAGRRRHEVRRLTAREDGGFTCRTDAASALAALLRHLSPSAWNSLDTLARLAGTEPLRAMEAALRHAAAEAAEAAATRDVQAEFRAMEQAEMYGHSLQREVAFLTVHSMFHLLGYDHEAGGIEAVRMREKEEATLIQLGLPRTVSYTPDE